MLDSSWRRSQLEPRWNSVNAKKKNKAVKRSGSQESSTKSTPPVPSGVHSLGSCYISFLKSVHLLREAQKTFNYSCMEFWQLRWEAGLYGDHTASHSYISWHDSPTHQFYSPSPPGIHIWGNGYTVVQRLIYSFWHDSLFMLCNRDIGRIDSFEELQNNAQPVLSVWVFVGIFPTIIKWDLL